MLNITFPVKAFGHYSADIEQLKTGESVVFTNIDIACHHALVMRLPGDTAGDSGCIPKCIIPLKVAEFDTVAPGSARRSLLINIPVASDDKSGICSLLWPMVYIRSGRNVG